MIETLLSMVLFEWILVQHNIAGHFLPYAQEADGQCVVDNRRGKRETTSRREKREQYQI